MTLSSPRPLPAGAGYAADPAVRHAATSGGVGSTIIRYLLESGAAAAAVSFTFDSRTLRYRPCLVTSAADYVSVGSIYHEVDLLGFLRGQAAALPGPLVCTCLPCQTKAVRSLLSRHGVGCFLIELTCSSQQSFAATDYLLRRLHVAPRLRVEPDFARPALLASVRCIIVVLPGDIMATAALGLLHGLRRSARRAIPAKLR